MTSSCFTLNFQLWIGQRKKTLVSDICSSFFFMNTFLASGYTHLMTGHPLTQDCVGMPITVSLWFLDSVWLFLQKLSYLRQILRTNRILHLTIHLVQTWYQGLLADLPWVLLLNLMSTHELLGSHKVNLTLGDSVCSLSVCLCLSIILCPSYSRSPQIYLISSPFHLSFHHCTRLLLTTEHYSGNY